MDPSTLSPAPWRKAEITPGSTAPTSKAGERIRTVDIHVGNVTSTDPQLTAGKGFVAIDDNARSKYAANRAGIGPDLGSVVEGWPTLPDAIKQAIHAIVVALC